MAYLKEELKTANEQIVVIFRGEKYELEDERSLVTVTYQADDSEEYKEETDPDILVNIIDVKGSIHIGDAEGGFFMHVQFDTSKISWDIKCSRVYWRVSGLIFPHAIEINLDKMEMLIRFDVFS